MDARSKKLLGDGLNAKIFRPSSKIKVSQKGKTFYSERGNNVQVGQDNKMCKWLTTS
jgi:hypothetical protein